jgi:hypothetical protein
MRFSCCQYEVRLLTLKDSLTKKLGGRRGTLPQCVSLVHHLGEQSREAMVYQVPKPPSSGLSKDRSEYSYARFPLLDPTLFRRPRPVDVRYMMGNSAPPRSLLLSVVSHEKM